MDASSSMMRIGIVKGTRNDSLGAKRPDPAVPNQPTQEPPVRIPPPGHETPCLRERFTPLCEVPIVVNAEAGQHQHAFLYHSDDKTSEDTSLPQCWRYRDTACVRLVICNFVNMFAR